MLPATSGFYMGFVILCFNVVRFTAIFY